MSFSQVLATTKHPHFLQFCVGLKRCSHDRHISSLVFLIFSSTLIVSNDSEVFSSIRFIKFFNLLLNTDIPQLQVQGSSFAPPAQTTAPPEKSEQPFSAHSNSEPIVIHWPGPYASTTPNSGSSSNNK